MKERISFNREQNFLRKTLNAIRRIFTYILFLKRQNMSSFTSKVQLVTNHIKCYPDFPKPGILFRDIFGVTANPDAARALQDLLFDYCSNLEGNVKAVCALESRGFLFGPQIALKLGIPFIPIRKPGKLPGEVKKLSFQLEYGNDTFEIQNNPAIVNANVLVVDDLLATGGSLSAACKLISSVGGKVKECLVVIELEELKGRKNVPSPVHSIIKL